MTTPDPAIDPDGYNAAFAESDAQPTHPDHVPGFTPGFAAYGAPTTTIDGRTVFLKPAPSLSTPSRPVFRDTVACRLWRPTRGNPHVVEPYEPEETP